VGGGVPSSDDRFDFKVKTYFEALSRAEMDRLIASEKLEILSEEVLTPPPEAAAGDEPSETVYVRVPPVLEARIEGLAREAKANTSINTWALRCFENCIKPAA
jgi:hypothetical protein